MDEVSANVPYILMRYVCANVPYVLYVYVHVSATLWQHAQTKNGQGCGFKVDCTLVFLQTVSTVCT